MTDTLATTNIRHLVIQQLIDTLKAKPELAGVQVEYSWPGDAMEREGIFAGDATGKVSIVLMSTGRKYRDDVFDLPVYIWAGRTGGTEHEARVRAAELLAPLEDVLADDPTLNNLTGLWDGGNYTLEGPHSTLTDEGGVASFTVTLHFQARYS